jgi:hypothetical protein
MPSAIPVDRDARVLQLWERAVGLDRWQRDDALLEDAPASPRGLGARNGALLTLRGGLFGRAWTLKSACPACATECEFEIDCQELAANLQGEPAEDGATCDWSGRSLGLRAPTVDDLEAIGRQADRSSAVRALLTRCVVGDFDPADADDSAIEALGRHIEQLDPGAVVAFQLGCPACRHEWSSVLDPGEAVWAELQRAAERTLVEIGALARAYGWTETEVMRLSPLRRAAYLQLVEGS